MIHQVLEPTAAGVPARRAVPQPAAWFPAAPYFQALLRSLPVPASGKATGRSIGITSCHRGEGVSLVAAGLATAAAAEGTHTLLVDANFQRPAVHRLFHANAEPGLAEALGAQQPSLPHVQSSGIANLSLLPAGAAEGRMVAGFSVESSKYLLHALEEDFDLVVFDLPESAEGHLLSPLIGLLAAVVLVVEAERVRWDVARRTVELLGRSGAKVLGTVLNKRRQHLPGWLYRP